MRTKPVSPHRRPGVTAAVLLLLFTLAAFATASPAERLMDHVRVLAHEAMEGRGIGTAGLDSAAAYITDQFRVAGLEPLFDGSFAQPFAMNWGAEVLPGTWLAAGGDTLRLGEEMMPLGFSSDGTVHAPVVFAGYGITAPEYDYDDYGEIDAEGKLVLVLEGEPNPGDSSSSFAGAFDTDHALLRTKSVNAKVHGAAGLLLVRRHGTPAPDSLAPPRTDEPYRDAGILAVRLRRDAVAGLFPRFNLHKAQRSIDANESPRSMAVSEDSLALHVNLRRKDVGVENVGAVLPGSDEVLIVGAHYDHLGMGQMGSLEKRRGIVHPGADDNASGVAVLLELARALAAEPPGPTVWFVAFTGEEVGLVGSNHFVNHPPAELDRAKLMVNLDMVGRMQDGRLTVYGIQSAKGLEPLARRAAEGIEGLEANLTGGGYGASDQTSFYSRGIPVLHLFTALHSDYHRASDVAGKLHPEGMARVLRFTESLLREAAREDVDLVYVKQEAPDRRGGRRGIPVSMGTIPDFAAPDSLRGLRLQGVIPGSPAAKAGLQEMDVLRKLGDVVIDNIYDFTFALRQHKPEDVVTVVFARDGEERTTEVTLGAPRGRRGGGHPGGEQKEKGGHPGGGHPGSGK